MIFLRKMVIFHTKYPKNFRASLRSAQFFKVRPPNLKSWIRPWYCPKFENHRRELFSNVLNYIAAILSAEDKFVWILSNEDPSGVRELAKFIHSCFQMAP
jgi:hypothetical protein